MPVVVNNMRYRNLIYVLMFLAGFLGRAGLSLESPAVSNPIGSGTVPPTTYQPGLIQSINPIDTTGNLIVTGNVAGGMQFRGIVPYSGVTDFVAPVGTIGSTSGAFDAFLRQTAGTQDIGQASGRLTPYYSSSLTVTTTIPGSRGMVAAPAGGVYGTEPFSRVDLPREQIGYYQRGYVTQFGNRPMALNRQEMEKLIEVDTARVPLGGVPVTELQSQERFWQEMRVPMSRRPEAQSIGLDRATPPGLTIGTEPNVSTLLSPRIDSRLGLTARQEKQSTTPPGYDIEKGAKQEGMPEQFITAGKGPGLDVYEQIKMLLVNPAIEVKGPTEGIGELFTKPMEVNEAAARPQTPGALKEDIERIKAGSILDTYKSFAAYSDDKFNKYIRAAEHYMKEGRYYRAADAYTIAAVYKPKDPLGYAGKSIALFASGEYMSSSLFLARAIEIFPEYPKVKVDLVAMIGDKDTIENRILDAREWRDKSDSGELEFLLSYVYYQMERMEFARQMIESASKKMPDSSAVAAMKKAIDERIAKP